MNQTADVLHWKERADKLLILWLEKGYSNGRLSTRLVDGTVVDNLSLLELMPIVLSEYLPKDIFHSFVNRLTGEGFLTTHGIATEAVNSLKFIQKKSYWRGAIWAPVTYLIVDGLSRGGAHELAQTIATRFCDTVAAGEGMFENYDALTGEGFDGPAYTWTASVFLLLASRYC